LPPQIAGLLRDALASYAAGGNALVAADDADGENAFDVCAVYFGAMREFFLRDTSVSPIFSEIDRQDLSDVHAREGSAL
jgi:hypothetical protein